MNKRPQYKQVRIGLAAADAFAVSLEEMGPKSDHARFVGVRVDAATKTGSFEPNVAQSYGFIFSFRGSYRHGRSYSHAYLPPSGNAHP